MRTPIVVALLLTTGACSHKHRAVEISARWQALGLPLLANRAEVWKGSAGEFQAIYPGLTFDVTFNEYREALQKAGYATAGKDDREAETWTADFTKGDQRVHLLASTGANDDAGSTISCK
ncbi:MAG TPA: hypothetical protein VGG74_17105 [Kofleriaceae bacterium]|jgi:ABC-type glycerol-3-phosphate transport system substrate-binding protein